jgi:hypothetical protein
MEALYFWVLVGLLGFLLYISPGFLVYRMYESFEARMAVKEAETAPAQAEINATGSTTANLTESPAPQPTPNQIQNLLEILNTPPPVASPTAPLPVATAVGAVARPVEYESVRSQPMSTREAPAPSQALVQGDLYKATLPPVPAPGSQGMMGAMGTQPATQGSAPAERVVYIERPSPRRKCNSERPSCERKCDNDRCDKPATNPNCPDMSDFIRKDSIPCWGCKLR